MGVGFVVATAVMVLFPLAALVAARLWRDPPPPELRVATHELAERLIAGLDRRLARTRRVFPLLVSSLAAAAVAAVYLLLHHGGLSLLYLALWAVRAFAESPWWLRRVRRRAEAAVTANA